MSYEDETAGKRSLIEKDEVDLGAGSELPVKAHFRRTEANYLFEKRGGQASWRLRELLRVLTKAVRRFCELNAPSQAELAYLLAEQLTYVECNPEVTARVLSSDAVERAKWMDGGDVNIVKFRACMDKVTELLIDLQMQYGYEATRRAVAFSGMSLHDMPPQMRTIGDLGEGKTGRGNDVDGKSIFDDLNEISDRLGVNRRGGSFVDQANVKLDRANSATAFAAEAADLPSGELTDDAETDSAVERIVNDMATPDPTPVPVNSRWCYGCKQYYEID